MEVQAGCRLIEEIERFPGGFLGELPGEFDPLGLASREGGRALAKLDVVEPDRRERLQLVADGRDIGEEREGFLHGHVKHVGDRFSFVLHFEGFPVVPFPPAFLALDVHIGQEVHLDLDHTVALTGFAPAAFQVEGEPARLVAPEFRLFRFGKDPADFVKDLGVGCRVAPRCLADGALVDHDHPVDLGIGFEAPVSTGHDPGVVELLLEGLVQGVVDEGRLPAP